MNDKEQTQLIHERVRALRKMRHEALAKSPEDALAYILASDKPVELVHSFPEEDFYFLVQDIGPEDALPLLALASNRQLDYLLDMNLWRQDRIHLPTAVRWLSLMMRADPQRISRWLAKDQLDFMEFFIYHNIQVLIREPDQDPSEFGPDFITFDEVFFFRLIEPTAFEFNGANGPGSQKIDYLKNREDVLVQFFRRLADVDHHLYENILLESVALIPAETEEELYRLRNVRLAEKGFLPFEDAIGLYQPFKTKNLRPAKRKVLPKTKTAELSLLTPFFPHHMMEPKSAFAKALSAVDKETILLLQSEFAALCNQLIVADRKDDITRKSLGKIVKKACGFISIGLHHSPRPGKALLQEYLLADLFRIGYGKVLELKWRVAAWRDSSWFMSQKLPLNFWDENGLGVIGGMLLKRPLFFDNYKSGVLYREFSTPEDIGETEKVLADVMAIDALFARLGVPIEPRRQTSPLTYKNFLLTLWARNYAGLDRETPQLLPIPMQAFQGFFNVLWEAGPTQGSVRLAMKNTFLKWLSQATGLSGTEITDRCGRSLENLFLEIENEYGAVGPQDLDSRFIPHFIIAP